MALDSTIYRFTVQLSDVDRGVYEEVKLRVACHPSESAPFLLTRVIAYLLNLQEGIQFSQGISSPDDPAIYVKDLTGVIQCWIDIGAPSAKRLHKATKASPRVRIYTHRDPEILLNEVKGAEIHRAETIEIFSLSPKFLLELEGTLERDNAWSLLHDEGELTVTVSGKSCVTELKRIS